MRQPEIMLLEHPTSKIGYLALTYACKTLGGPFVVAIDGQPLSYASKPALRIS